MISIGIPTYNRAPYLEGCLWSIGEQSWLKSLTSLDWGNIEILISDDCSSDGTENLVKRIIGDSDLNIKYYRRPKNLGDIANFLFLAEQATGDYFMWLGDDDRLHPEFLDKLHYCIRPTNQHNIENRLFPDFAFSDIVVLDKNNLEYRKPQSFQHFTEDCPGNYRSRMNWSCSAVMIQSLWRKPFLDNLIAKGCFPNCWGYDIVLVYAALLSGTYAHVPEKLYYKANLRTVATPELIEHYRQVDSGEITAPFEAPQEFWDAIKHVEEVCR